MLERIDDDWRVAQRCAGCDKQRELQLTEMNVGTIVGHAFDARSLVLPLCPACGSREVLIASAEGETHPFPGSVGHLHQLLVDHLCATLVERGRVLPDVVKRRGLLKPALVAKDSLAQWFPDGFKFE